MNGWFPISDIVERRQRGGASGRVPAGGDLCELLDRADVTVLVFDEVRSDRAEMAESRCPKLKYRISMQAEEGRRYNSFFPETAEKYKGSLIIHRNRISSVPSCHPPAYRKEQGRYADPRNLAENATCLDMKNPERTVILSVLPIHHAYCLSMDILKGISLGSVICINDSLMRVVKNIKLFKPEMILMVPLMIETIAKKLQESALIPAAIVKSQVFRKTVSHHLQRRSLSGSLFTSICSGSTALRFFRDTV